MATNCRMDTYMSRSALVRRRLFTFLSRLLAICCCPRLSPSAMLSLSMTSKPEAEISAMPAPIKPAPKIPTRWTGFSGLPNRFFFNCTRSQHKQNALVRKILGFTVTATKQETMEPNLHGTEVETHKSFSFRRLGQFGEFLLLFGVTGPNQHQQC